MRQRRWLELFKDYDCIIDYHLGKTNVVADALSRKTVSTLALQFSRGRITPDGVLLTQLKAQLVLKQMIVDAQTDDVEFQKKVQLVRKGVKTDYSIKENGEVYYNNILCLPDDKEVKNKLLYEAHNTVFTMHLGGTKMYQDLKKYYWWRGIKKDVTEYVSKCLTCQQVKFEHQVLSGLLNPISIPQWK